MRMDDREPNDRDGEMDPEDAARWRAARTLADLGELTAQWLEGKIASIPAVVPGCGPEIGRAHVYSSHVEISYAVFCLKKKKKRSECINIKIEKKITTSGNKTR